MKFTFEPESRPLDGFTIKRAIYRGGFGEVYYGLSDAGREVALKLLQNNSEIELRGVQQCLNLSHPNLVTIFDVRQDADGDQWIVMEYVAGETLDAAIRRYPQGMPAETVLKWLPGLIAGAGFLHSRGLVHRDLKPANIFIENGVVKIGDVGLSKFITPSQRSAQTQSVGTVYYMAPEVAKGRYGKEVDVYALGVILYEMLTGQVPFDGESTGEILMKHLTELPDVSKLPPRLRGVIGKALRKDPQERYQSVEAFSKAFTDAMLGRDETSAADVAPVQASPTAVTNSESVEEPPVWLGAAIGLLVGMAITGFRFSGSASLLLYLTTSAIGYMVAQSGVFSRRRSAHRSDGQSDAQGTTLKKYRWVILVVMVLAMVAMTRGNIRPNWSHATMMLIAFGVAEILKRKGNLVIGGASAGSKSPPRAFPHAMAARPFPTTAVERPTFMGPAFLAVPITGGLSGLIAALIPSLFQVESWSSSADLSYLVFFVSVAALGAWAILADAWIRNSGRARPQGSRWRSGALGAMVGMAAGGLGQYLMIELPTQGAYRPEALFQSIGERPLILDQQGPTVLGYMVFFAMLFAFRNWPAMTSPRRETQFRIGSVFMTLLTAWVTTKVFAFPLPWAWGWAAVMACTVQLVSNWSPSDLGGRRHARMAGHRR